jgi:hypothetical protein
MKEVFILYIQDMWNCNGEAIAVCETFEDAYLLAEMHAKDLSKDLSKDDKHNLATIGQTQGRENNYAIVQTPLNKFI